ncbi:hypothetical protein ACO0R3_001696 [Hanseniaspora guilliermondii]
MNNQYNTIGSSIRNMEMNKSNTLKGMDTDSPLSRGSMLPSKVILPPITHQMTNQHVIQPHANPYRYHQSANLSESSLWSKQRPIDSKSGLGNFGANIDDSLAAARLVVNFSNMQQNYNMNLPPVGNMITKKKTGSDEKPVKELKEETHVQKIKKTKKVKTKERCMVCFEMFSNLKTHSALHMDVEKRPFKCLFCSRGFARNNDLQRHQRKHLLEKNLEGNNVINKKINSKNVCATELGFKCPFYENKEDLQVFGNESMDEDDYVPKRCHSTGIFTRCDTFKNHLKALHFRYPKGTIRKNRNNVSGYCKHCSMYFDNCKVWADEHVLKGKCNNNRPFKNYMLVKTIPIESVKKNDNIVVVESQSKDDCVPTSASVLDLNTL